VVEVRPSGRPGAGLGVWALVDVPAGTRLTRYRGEAEPPEAPPPGGIITLDVLAERCLAWAREYSLQLEDGRTLVGSPDCSDPGLCGQVLNDAGCVKAADALQTGGAGALEGYINAIVAGANARLEVGAGRADAVAARDIEAGEELLTAYSSPWWLAKVGAELQWWARRSASYGDTAEAEATWELLEELEMASELYTGVELEALHSCGLFTHNIAEAQFKPWARPPSPELDGSTSLEDRLALAAMQWKATSAPLRRRLITKYGLEDKH